MGPGRLPERIFAATRAATRHLVLGAALAALGTTPSASPSSALWGCADGPRISPWGTAGRLRLADYAERPDLDHHLALVDAEAARLDLEEDFRVTAKDPRSGEPVVAIALRGADGMGRRLSATRIVSPWGVVLARGPLDLRDVGRTSATELLRTLGGGDAGPDRGGGFGPLADVTGDGVSDVVLRSERGKLELWTVTSRGSTEIVVRLDVLPTEARDVDGDGSLDLAGRVVLAEGDPIAPHFSDVATFAGGAYSHGTPEARAWHATRRDLARVALANARSDRERLRSALQVAWHGILAGGDREAELVRLNTQRAPPELADAWHDHARRVGRIGL